MKCGSLRTTPLQSAVEQLAAISQVTNEAVKKLINRVPNNAPILNRFFDKATPAWFVKLRKKGYFQSPSRLQAHPDGYFVYEQWPPGRYLVRLASDPRYSQEVVDLVLALDTDNPQAAETVADVALAVPVELVRPLIAKIVKVLRSPAQWGLPSKAVSLLPVLVRGGQQVEAAALLEALLPVPARRGSGGGYLDRSLVKPLFPAVGCPASPRSRVGWPTRRGTPEMT